MGLFNFLRRKAGPVIDYKENKSIREVISEGIRFETNNIFIKWGTGVDDLAKEIPVRKERRSDRTIYHFGKQIILNGLELDLTAVFWDHKEEDQLKRLLAIEFLSLSDKEARNRLKLIISHLENQIGMPIKNETDDSEVLMEWRIKDVKLSLSFIERYANKIHFQIRKEI